MTEATDTTTLPGRAGSEVQVEVAGIEPASSSDDPGLLRAQLVKSFSRPLHSRQHVADRPSLS